MKKLSSTGNDVVHLDVTNSARTCEKKFYTKILAGAEVHLYELITSQLSFNSFVWLLWSAKEAAYKYLQRLTPDLIFSPTKFVVTHLEFPVGCEITGFELSQIDGTGFTDTSIKGTVSYGTLRLHFHSISKREFVMSVVNEDENFDGVHWGIKLIDQSHPEYQSSAVREFVLNRLENNLSYGIKINKNRCGIPVIVMPGSENSIPVSLSHHHHVVAYSFRI